MAKGNDIAEDKIQWWEFLQEYVDFMNDVASTSQHAEEDFISKKQIAKEWAEYGESIWGWIPIIKNGKIYLKKK